MVLVCHVVLQDHVIIWSFDLLYDYLIRTTKVKTPSCQVLWRYNDFSLSRDLPRPRDQRVE